MQEVWKTCLHSGLNAQTTESPTLQALIQIAQMLEISLLVPSGGHKPDFSLISIETRPHTNLSELERSILLSSTSPASEVGSGDESLWTSSLLVLLSFIAVPPMELTFRQKLVSSSIWTSELCQCIVASKLYPRTGVERLRLLTIELCWIQRSILLTFTSFAVIVWSIPSTVLGTVCGCLLRDRSLQHAAIIGDTKRTMEQMMTTADGYGCCGGRVTLLPKPWTQLTLPSTEVGGNVSMACRRQAMRTNCFETRCSFKVIDFVPRLRMVIVVDTTNHHCSRSPYQFAFYGCRRNQPRRD